MLSRQDATVITNEILAAVNEILDRHGLERGKVSSTYGDQYSFKVTASEVVKNGNGANVQDPYSRNLVELLTMSGLTDEQAESVIGAEFNMNGTEGLRIVGVNYRARKMPFVYENPTDGKRYKTVASRLHIALIQNEVPGDIAHLVSQSI